MSSIRAYVTDTENVTIFAAIVLAVAAGYGFALVFDPTGGFLALVLVGVIVPGVHDRSRPDHDSARDAVAWVAVASAVALTAYTVLYVVFVRLPVSAETASAVAFLVTALGGSAVAYSLPAGDGTNRR